MVHSIIAEEKAGATAWNSLAAQQYKETTYCGFVNVFLITDQLRKH